MTCEPPKAASGGRHRPWEGAAAHVGRVGFGPPRNRCDCRHSKACGASLELAQGFVEFPRPSTPYRRICQHIYLERWRIFRRLRWRRRVRFFFHFQRILEWAFFQGLDLWPPPRRRRTR